MILKEDNNKNKIAILIAAYNEEEHVKAVIKGCLKYHLDIIVIDDGSTDSTLKKIRSIPSPKGHKIVVIRHRTNKGKGKALRTGFLYATKKNYSGIITLDADGQHDTEEIKNFLEIVEKDNPDLIIGNRMADTKNMPFIRLATNIITSWMISVISRSKVSDVQSGFKYIKTDVLKNIKLETGNFDTEPEIIMKSSWSGYNIVNMPVKTIYHKNFTSHVNPLTDTIKFFKLVFNSLRWKRRIYKKS